MSNKIITYSLFVFLFLGMTACEREFIDPSSAVEQQVVNDATGIIALCNGLPYRFTVGRASNGYATPVASGLTSKELRVLNAGNADEDFLEKGGANVQGNNAVVRTIWENANLVKATADLIITNSNNLTDAATKSGVVAFASIYKAMALGTLAQFFEQAPLAVGKNATFSKREDVLKEAIKLLETATTSLTTAPSAFFTSRIVTGMDMPNTINALTARYNLMLGNYDAALAAANKVDVSKKSAFNFDDVSRNPIFESVTSNRNVVEPVNATNMGLPDALKPDAADKRLAFFINTTAGANLGKNSFYTANTSQIPIYRGGEMTLIKAEAYARKSQLTEAVAELDKILTKKAAADVWGIGADLTAYAGEKTQEAVLTEIYKQRCIELFLTGLKIDDSRRFGRPTAERSRNFYPYPLTERDNNTSTPADPAN